MMTKKIVNIIILFLSIVLLISCMPSENQNDLGINHYRGNQQDLYLNDWEYDINAFRFLREEQGVEIYEMNKSFGLEYAGLNTGVSGYLGDFYYINIRLRFESFGHTMRIRILQDIEYGEDNMIGADYDFAVSDEMQTYTLKIKSTFRPRLDVANYVALLPNASRSGLEYYDTMHLESVWFSMEMPDDTTLVNEHVDDDQDNAIIINGYKTWAWTNYIMYPLGEHIRIIAQGAADYAMIEKEITLSDDDNEVYIRFENESYFSSTSSITRISFSLAGDYSHTVSEGVEYPYHVYYEHMIGVYEFDGQTLLTDDVELSFSLADALIALHGRYEDGLRIRFFIESHVATQRGELVDGRYNYDGIGQMSIKELTTRYNDTITGPPPGVLTLNSTFDTHADGFYLDNAGDIVYGASAVENGEFVVTLNEGNVPQNQWEPHIARSIISMQEGVYHIKFEITSDVDRTILFKIVQPSGDYPSIFEDYHYVIHLQANQTYYFDITVVLTRNWSNLKFEIDLGHGDELTYTPGTIRLDNVYIGP